MRCSEGRSVGMKAGGRWRCTGRSSEVPGIATAAGDPQSAAWVVSVLSPKWIAFFAHHMDRLAHPLHA